MTPFPEDVGCGKTQNCRGMTFWVLAAGLELAKGFLTSRACNSRHAASLESVATGVVNKADVTSHPQSCQSTSTLCFPRYVCIRRIRGFKYFMKPQCRCGPEPCVFSGKTRNADPVFASHALSFCRRPRLDHRQLPTTAHLCLCVLRICRIAGFPQNTSCQCELQVIVKMDRFKHWKTSVA